MKNNVSQSITAVGNDSHQGEFCSLIDVSIEFMFYLINDNTLSIALVSTT